MSQTDSKEIQRFNVRHWMGENYLIPSIIAQGDGVYYLNIPVDQIGQKLLEFSKEFDIMLLDLRDGDPPFIWFDTKGRRFKQR